MDVLGMFDPIALQGSEVIPVTQLAKQLLEDRPVTVAACGSKLAFEMAPEIGLDAVIVEQGVVNIDKKDGLVGTDHRSRFIKMMCVVPQPDGRLCEVVFVTKYAEGGRAQQ